MKAMALFLVFACSIVFCGSLWAGPINNAQEFQNKAARAAAEKNIKPKPVIIEKEEGKDIVAGPGENSEKKQGVPVKIERINLD